MVVAAAAGAAGASGMATTIWVFLKGTAGKGLAGLVGKISKLGSALNIVKKILSAVGRVFGFFWRVIKRTFKWALALGTYMAQRFVRGMIAASAEAERFALALGQVSDSSQDAKEAMRWVREFARTTPFYTKEIVKSFNILKAVGVADIKAVITASADAAFVMQRDVSEVSMAFVSLLRRTWRRLGVDLDRTGKKVKITTAKMRIETEKNVDAIRAGLLEVMQKTFGGATKKAQTTWSGMLKILASEWWEFKVAVGESGVFNFLKAGLRTVLDWITRMKDEGQLVIWARQVGDALMEVIKWVIILGLRVKRFGELAWWALGWIPKLLGKIASRLGAEGLDLFPGITLGPEMKQAEEIMDKLRATMRSMGQEMEKAANARGRSVKKARELLSFEKERLGMAKQFAGLGFEEQRKIEQARDILKGLLAMDKEKAQAQFDNNEELRKFVAGNKILAQQYMPFLTKWIEKGLKVYGSSKREVDDILSLSGMLVEKTQDRLDKERQITAEVIKQNAQYRDQIRRWNEIQGTAGPGISPRSGLPQVSDSTASIYDITAKAGLMATAGVGAQERERVELAAFQTTRDMVATLNDLSINAKFDQTYIINVDAKQIAKDIESHLGIPIDEAKLALIGVIQQMVRDVDAKAKAARAASAQRNAN